MLKISQPLITKKYSSNEFLKASILNDDVTMEDIQNEISKKRRKRKHRTHLVKY
mgnify:CR=1 FL=1